MFYKFECGCIGLPLEEMKGDHVKALIIKDCDDEESLSIKGVYLKVPPIEISEEEFIYILRGINGEKAKFQHMKEAINTLLYWAKE
jgi:hypothetical protein